MKDRRRRNGRKRGAWEEEIGLCSPDRFLLGGACGWDKRPLYNCECTLPSNISGCGILAYLSWNCMGTWMEGGGKG